MKAAGISLLVCTLVLAGCGGAPWERMADPDIQGTNALAAVNAFIATNGWTMRTNADAVCWEEIPSKKYIQGLPWRKLNTSRLMLAHGDVDVMVAGLLAYALACILTIAALIASFACRPRSAAAVVLSSFSALYGLALAAWILSESFEWCAGLWFSILPSVAGLIGLIRFGTSRHERQAD